MHHNLFVHYADLLLLFFYFHQARMPEVILYINNLVYAYNYLREVYYMQNIVRRFKVSCKANICMENEHSIGFSLGMSRRLFQYLCFYCTSQGRLFSVSLGCAHLSSSVAAQHSSYHGYYIVVPICTPLLLPHVCSDVLS